MRNILSPIQVVPITSGTLPTSPTRINGDFIPHCVSHFGKFNAIVLFRYFVRLIEWFAVRVCVSAVSVIFWDMLSGVFCFECFVGINVDL